jgi:purine-binding chemotaxis protein CheW
MTAAGDMGVNAIGHGTELLSIKLGDQDFALDIMSVREIRGWIASTPFPHAPHYIKGMINLRGVILAIVDLAERLALPTHEPDPSSVVVVVEAGNRTVGLVVDAVCDIITVTKDMIQAPPDVGSNSSIQLVEGLLTLEGRIVSVLDISTILPHDTAPMPIAA